MHYSSDIFQSFIITMLILASKDDVKYHLLNKSDLHLSHLMTILIVVLNWFKIIAYIHVLFFWMYKKGSGAKI